jgi:TonB family protein
MMSKINFSRHFGFSLCLHIMILLVISGYLVIDSSKEKQYGLRAIKPIWVTVASNEKMIPEQTIKNLIPSVSPLSPLKMQKISVVQHQHLRPRLEEKSMHGSELNDFIQTIYTQIHQHYEVSEQALILREFGVTEVSFLLLQDGTIKALSVTKPSKFPLLDLAALQAVSNASPFTFGKHALLKPQTFIIPIDFSTSSYDEN